MTGCVRRVAAVGVACTVSLPFVVTGSGAASASSSSLCKDYAALARISGTRTSAIKAAEAMYRKLAREAPAKAKADLLAVANAEAKVASGHAASVDNAKVRAAAARADSVLGKKCSGAKR